MTQGTAHVGGPEGRSLEPDIVQRRTRAALPEPLGDRQAQIQPGPQTDLSDHKGLIRSLRGPALG